MTAAYIHPASRDGMYGWLFILVDSAMSARQVVTPQPNPQSNPQPVHAAMPQGETPAPGAPPPGASAGRRKPSRISFWVGFAIGFALLAIAACNAAWFGLGFNQLTLAQITGDEVAWVAPTLIPTVTPAPPTGNNTDNNLVVVSGGRFAPGETVRNVTGSRVNLRRTPGHLGKEEDDILGQMAAGDAVVIQGESSVADNLTWWRVTWQGLDGWVAEATASGVQILGE